MAIIIVNLTSSTISVTKRKHSRAFVARINMKNIKFTLGKIQTDVDKIPIVNNFEVNLIRKSLVSVFYLIFIVVDHFKGRLLLATAI